MTPTPTRASALLRQAAAIVDGPRRQTHGEAERSFGAVAALWDAYLAARPGGMARQLRPSDTAAMLLLLKLARSQHGEADPDHARDMAGYAGLYGELLEAERRWPDQPPTSVAAVAPGGPSSRAA